MMQIDHDPNGTLAAMADLIPEGALPSHALRVVAYLDEDGDEMYSIAHEGRANLSSWLGLAELFKENMLAEFQGYRMKDDDEET